MSDRPTPPRTTISASALKTRLSDPRQAYIERAKGRIRKNDELTRQAARNPEGTLRQVIASQTGALEIASRAVDRLGSDLDLPPF